MGKNIVVCGDGTGNEYGANNTNIVYMYPAVIRDAHQLAYYDPGIGTFSIFDRTLGRKVGILLGQAFGYELRENIEDAYEYLMNRYLPGDKLFFLGLAAARSRCGCWPVCSIRLGCYKKAAET